MSQGGLLLLQTVGSSGCTHFHLSSGKILQFRYLVAFDNLGVLNKSKECQRKIPWGVKPIGVLHLLQCVHAALRGSLHYQHFHRHKDKHKTWVQLILMECLNQKYNLAGFQGIQEGTVPISPA